MQKETKTRISYQGKIKADGAELEKMKVEHKHHEEKVRKLAKEKELKRQQQQDTVHMLEEQCTEKKREEGRLSILYIVQGHCSNVLMSYVATSMSSFVFICPF